MKKVLIFVACVLGLCVGFFFGPIGSLPSAFAINSSYISLLEIQYLLMGLLASVFACLVAYLFRIKPAVVGIIILISGVLFVLASNIGEQNPFEYLLASLTEFLVPYLSISFITLGLYFWFIRAAIQRSEKAT